MTSGECRYEYLSCKKVKVKSFPSPDVLHKKDFPKKPCRTFGTMLKMIRLCWAAPVFMCFYLFVCCRMDSVLSRQLHRLSHGLPFCTTL